MLNNSVGGIIDLQADAGNISWSGTAGVLNNAGVLERSTNPGLVQILVNLNNSGTIEVALGELEITGSRPFVNEGTGIVKGIGIFDLPTVTNYTNNGIFAPGLSPGTLNVQGDYVSTSSSQLDIELDGLVADTEYDVLAITGNNNVFEGSVNVTMGFEGTIGDQFTIATTSGSIATANLESPIENVDFNGKRYTFEVSYPDNNKVVLTITDKLDILPPEILTQDITIQLDTLGNASITTAQIDNGTTDNCTPISELVFSLDVTDFTCADLGDNTVNLTVTDNDNNMATLSANVTVEDVIIPVISCPSDLIVESSGAYMLPDYFLESDVTATDNCAFTVVQTPAPGTLVTNGDTEISFNVIDDSGNTSDCSFILTVNDTTLSLESNILQGSHILVFPNPTTDKITIKNTSNAKLVNAIISDVKGSVIYKENLRLMGTEKTISIENYETGVYFMRIESENNVIVKRFIKQ